MDRNKPASPKTAAGKKIVYSTTDGRQRFPDILQVTYGDKAVIGFDRYGRALGAVVPMEAVRMLAGLDSDVDEDIRSRIERAATALLAEMATNGESDQALVEVQEITEARRSPSGERVRSRNPLRRKYA